MAHTHEVVNTLKIMADLLDKPEVVTYVVYGSRSRPISSTWARIPDAVYIQNDQATQRATGFHTYVAVPQMLDKKIVKSYDLTFVSNDAQEEREQAFLKRELEHLISAEVAHKEVTSRVKALAEIAANTDHAYGLSLVLSEYGNIQAHLEQLRHELEQEL